MEPLSSLLLLQGSPWLLSLYPVKAALWVELGTTTALQVGVEEGGGKVGALNTGTQICEEAQGKA